MAGSTSSKVLKWLQYINVHTPGRVFTTQDAFDELREEYGDQVTKGGVNGFLSKALAAEHLTATRVGKIYKYKIKDLTGLKALEQPSRGGTAGRESHHSLRVGKSSSAEYIRDQLLDIAAKVEKIHTPLSTFSTEDLLKELTKRHKTKGS